MKTEVVIQVNKRKKVTKEALVVEGFKEKYINPFTDYGFKKIFGDSWGPRLEHILRNTILALLEYPNSTR